MPRPGLVVETTDDSGTSILIISPRERLSSRLSSTLKKRVSVASQPAPRARTDAADESEPAPKSPTQGAVFSPRERIASFGNGMKKRVSGATSGTPRVKELGISVTTGAPEDPEPITKSPTQGAVFSPRERMASFGNGMKKRVSAARPIAFVPLPTDLSLSMDTDDKQYTQGNDNIKSLQQQKSKKEMRIIRHDEEYHTHRDEGAVIYVDRDVYGRSSIFDEQDVEHLEDDHFYGGDNEYDHEMGFEQDADLHTHIPVAQK